MENPSKKKKKPREKLASLYENGKYKGSLMRFLQRNIEKRERKTELYDNHNHRGLVWVWVYELV